MGLDKDLKPRKDPRVHEKEATKPIELDHPNILMAQIDHMASDDLKHPRKIKFLGVFTPQEEAYIRDFYLFDPDKKGEMLWDTFDRFQVRDAYTDIINSVSSPVRGAIESIRKGECGKFVVMADKSKKEKPTGKAKKQDLESIEEKIPVYCSLLVTEKMSVIDSFRQNEFAKLENTEINRENREITKMNQLLPDTKRKALKPTIDLISVPKFDKNPSLVFYGTRYRQTELEKRGLGYLEM